VTARSGDREAVASVVAGETGGVDGVGLPFVGEGYGAIVITVMVVVGVVLLTLGGLLGGEAAAAIFGTVLGYAFGTRIAAARSTQSGEEQKP
jgi:hypothetical protein